MLPDQHYLRLLHAYIGVLLLLLVVLVVVVALVVLLVLLVHRCMYSVIVHCSSSTSLVNWCSCSHCLCYGVCHLHLGSLHLQAICVGIRCDVMARLHADISQLTCVTAGEAPSARKTRLHGAKKAVTGQEDHSSLEPPVSKMTPADFHGPRKYVIASPEPERMFRCRRDPRNDGKEFKNASEMPSRHEYRVISSNQQTGIGITKSPRKPEGRNIMTTASKKAAATRLSRTMGRVEATEAGNSNSNAMRHAGNSKKPSANQQGYGTVSSCRRSQCDLGMISTIHESLEQLKVQSKSPTKDDQDFAQRIGIAAPDLRRLKEDTFGFRDTSFVVPSRTRLDLRNRPSMPYIHDYSTRHTVERQKDRAQTNINNIVSTFQTELESVQRFEFERRLKQELAKADKKFTTDTDIFCRNMAMKHSREERIACANDIQNLQSAMKALDRLDYRLDEEDQQHSQSNKLNGFERCLEADGQQQMDITLQRYDQSFFEKSGPKLTSAARKEYLRLERANAKQLARFECGTDAGTDIITSAICEYFQDAVRDAEAELQRKLKPLIEESERIRLCQEQATRELERMKKDYREFLDATEGFQSDLIPAVAAVKDMCRV